MKIQFLSLFIAICAIGTTPAPAQSLLPDIAFGNSGFLEVPLNAPIKGFLPMADGDILLAYIDKGTKFIVSRFKRNGELDLNFGYNGKTELQSMNCNQECPGIIELQNGKIMALVVATWGNGSCSDPFDVDFNAFRLTADGTTDVTYGQQGRANWYSGDRMLFSEPNQMENGHFLTCWYDANWTAYREFIELDAEGNPVAGMGKINLQNGEYGSPMQALVNTGNSYIAILTNDHATALAQYFSDGKLAGSFGSGVQRIYGIGQVSEVLELTNKKAVLSIKQTDLQQESLIEVNLETAKINPLFGANGRIDFSFETPFTPATKRTIRQHPDGSWTAVQCGDSTLEVIRLTAGLLPDESFGPAGRAVLATAVHGKYDPLSIKITPAKDIFLAGFFTQSGVKKSGLYKFNVTPSTATGAVADNIDSTPMIWPNPVRGCLELTSDIPIDRIEVFTTAGNAVFSTENPGSQVNVARLIPGHYCLKITEKSGGAPVFRQFIKL